jgi:hemin uptake protein HemP
MNAADNEEEDPNKGAHERVSAGVERRLTIADNHMDSRDLFVGTRDVVIVHGRDAYHLRLTAQNKLILTK